MAAIIPFLKDRAFEPHDIQAMSMAFDDVCKLLGLIDELSREVMAVRIIELARRGERSPTKLRDRVLYETGLANAIETPSSNRNDSRLEA
jgi:tartrate dehydratase beta subunit/fumarate hydratase class I family protein